MNAFMLWMSGNSIQIFSILITVMLFWNSLKAILAVHATFERFAPVSGGSAGGAASEGEEGGPTATTTTNDSKGTSFLAGLLDLPSDPLVLQKLAYMGMQLVLVALGMWKCHSMGLLPTSASDWLAFEQPKGLDALVAGYIALSPPAPM